MSDVALIERIQALTEPCRESDGELLCAALGWEKRWSDFWGTFTFHKGDTWQGLGTVPKFTESIDVALTLVPQGMTATIWTGGAPEGVTRGPAARLFYYSEEPEGGFVIGSASPHEIFGATPAIAICLAVAVWKANA